MEIHGRMAFPGFQEDDIPLPGFYTFILPAHPRRSAPLACLAVALGPLVCIAAALDLLAWLT